MNLLFVFFAYKPRLRDGKVTPVGTQSFSLLVARYTFMQHNEICLATLNALPPTMFCAGTGVRWREWDVIGNTCHRSSINSTFLHSTKDSRNLHMTNSSQHNKHSQTITHLISNWCRPETFIGQTAHSITRTVKLLHILLVIDVHQEPS